MLATLQNHSRKGSMDFKEHPLGTLSFGGILGVGVALVGVLAFSGMVPTVHIVIEVSNSSTKIRTSLSIAPILSSLVLWWSLPSFWRSRCAAISRTQVGKRWYSYMMR